MSASVSIAGLDEAEVLAALYNASRPLGLGHLHFTPEPMSADEARAILDRTRDLDYVKGRVIKVTFFDESFPESAWNVRDGFNPVLYDRDNGQGAAASVVAELRAKAGAA